MEQAGLLTYAQRLPRLPEGHGLSDIMRLAHNYSDGIVPDLHRVPFQSIAELIPTATTAEILTFLQNNIFFEICPYFLPIHHIPIHYIR